MKVRYRSEKGVERVESRHKLARGLTNRVPGNSQSLVVRAVNLRSPVAEDRWVAWCSWMMHNHADVWIITECKVTSQMFKIFRSIARNWSLWVNWNGTNNGVGIAVPVDSKFCALNEKMVVKDLFASLIYLPGQLSSGERLDVVAVYGVRDRETCEEQVRILQDRLTVKCIVGGDFNWDATRDGRNSLVSLLFSKNFVDVDLNSDHTFERGGHRASLDHFWCHKEVKSEVQGRVLEWDQDARLSDHKPIEMEYTVEQSESQEVSTRISRWRKKHFTKFLN